MQPWRTAVQHAVQAFHEDSAALKLSLDTLYTLAAHYTTHPPDGFPVYKLPAPLSYTPKAPREGHEALRTRCATTLAPALAPPRSPLSHLTPNWRSLGDSVVHAGRTRRRTTSARGLSRWTKVSGASLSVLLHALFALGVLRTTDASLTGNVTLYRFLTSGGCVAVDWPRIKVRARHGKDPLLVPGLVPQPEKACVRMGEPTLTQLLAVRAKLSVFPTLGSRGCRDAISFATLFAAARAALPQPAPALATPPRVPWAQSAQWHERTEAVQRTRSTSEWEQLSSAQQPRAKRKLTAFIAGQEYATDAAPAPHAAFRCYSSVVSHGCGHPGCLSAVHVWYGSNGDDKRQRWLHSTVDLLPPLDTQPVG